MKRKILLVLVHILQMAWKRTSSASLQNAAISHNFRGQVQLSLLHTQEIPLKISEEGETNFSLREVSVIHINGTQISILVVTHFP